MACSCNRKARLAEQAATKVANARLLICQTCDHFDGSCKLLPGANLAEEVKKTVSPCPANLHQ